MAEGEIDDDAPSSSFRPLFHEEVVKKFNGSSNIDEETTTTKKPMELTLKVVAVEEGAEIRDDSVDLDYDEREKHHRDAEERRAALFQEDAFTAVISGPYIDALRHNRSAATERRGVLLQTIMKLATHFGTEAETVLCAIGIFDRLVANKLSGTDADGWTVLFKAEDRPCLYLAMASFVTACKMHDANRTTANVTLRSVWTAASSTTSTTKIGDQREAAKLATNRLRRAERDFGAFECAVVQLAAPTALAFVRDFCADDRETDVENTAFHLIELAALGPIFVGEKPSRMALCALRLALHYHARPERLYDLAAFFADVIAPESPPELLDSFIGVHCRSLHNTFTVEGLSNAPPINGKLYHPKSANRTRSSISILSLPKLPASLA